MVPSAVAVFAPPAGPKSGMARPRARASAASPYWYHTLKLSTPNDSSLAGWSNVEVTT